MDLTNFCKVSSKGATKVPICVFNDSKKKGGYQSKCIDPFKKGATTTGLKKKETFVECGCCIPALGEVDPPEFCLPGFDVNAATSRSKKASKASSKSSVGADPMNFD